MKPHSGMVDVFVRIRPTAKFARGLIECLPDGQTVNIYNRKDSRKLQDSKKGQLSFWSFRLEGVLKDVSQEEVYARVCQRVLQGALEGYNGTVLCFGQTGAGKTYTMTGSTESYQYRGIIPRALQEVFREVDKRTEHSLSVLLSYLEIYNETLVDLLSPQQGSTHRSRGMAVVEEAGRGMFVRGLSLHPVRSEEEALNLMFQGEMSRIIGSHALNRNSSRSHCIFTMHIESRSRSLSDATYITSKLNLVDLAGSERLGKTGSGRQMLTEATYINKSLSFLEQVIVALADCHRDHVPYRQSKLTHVLKDSLGGNCNTVLVANIYGEAAQIEETLSTLRFASRMKCVRTDPTINEHTDPALQIKKLQQEIQMLKEELSMYKTPNELLPGAQLAEIDSQVQRFLDGSLKEITVTSIRQAQALFAQIKLAVQEQKQKVMAQLCHKCSLAEKNQNGNIGAIKEQDTRGGSDDVEAGSTGTSAQSPKQTRDPSSTTSKTVKLRDKQSQRKRQGGGSPASRKRSESASKSKLNSAQMPEREQESQKPDTESLDSQPPENKSFPPGVVSLPPKAEAFEDFKAGQGHMITCILKDNKAVLLERRGLLRQLTEDVSAVKRKIDCTTATIQQRKEMRETQGQYLVMEEEEELDDTLILQLRELKTLYQQRCAALRDIKAEVNYCQHLVDQCTVRLLSEFETWYKKTCLFPEEELQMTMSLAKWNKALSITPMQNSSSAGSGQRRHFPIPPVT